MHACCKNKYKQFECQKSFDKNWGLIVFLKADDWIINDLFEFYSEDATSRLCQLQTEMA